MPAGVISAGGIRTLEEKELYIGISACELGDSELTRRRCRDRCCIQRPLSQREKLRPHKGEVEPERSQRVSAVLGLEPRRPACGSVGFNAATSS